MKQLVSTYTEMVGVTFTDTYQLSKRVKEIPSGRVFPDEFLNYEKCESLLLSLVFVCIYGFFVVFLALAHTATDKANNCSNN